MITQRLYIGGAWSLMLRLGAIIVMFGTNALLTRLLPPQEAGTYFLLYSLASAAALTAQLGLGPTAVRTIAESLSLHREGRVRAIIQRIFWCGGLSTSIIALSVASGLGRRLMAAVFDAPLMAEMAGLMAPWLAVIAMSSLVAEIFRGFHDIRYATLFGTFLNGFLCFILLGLVWLWHGRASLAAVVRVNIFAWAICGLLASIILRNKIAKFVRSETVSDSELLIIAWPLWISNLTFLVTRQVDIWIIGSYLPEEQVAIYTAAARLMAFVDFPLILMNTVIPPFITELYAQDKKQTLQDILRTAATLSGFLAILVTLLFWFFGDCLLNVVYGSFYREGHAVLSILAIGYLINVLSGSCGFALMMTGHQLIFMIISLITGLLMTVGTIYVVEPFGIIGVACIASIMISIQNILMLVCVRIKLKLWTHITFSFHTSKKILLEE
jgi:O-antigen/teichoic acid export membrane protein